ncbi:MAG TPA: hypothetical protein PKB13_10120 [Clostridia bacterium]|nr:hypothetical protein [Clostridia bacterium]
MSDKEKEVAQALADAFNALSDNKKEYMIGFAEGVAAMAKMASPTRDEKEKQTA